jgi:tRNA (cytosine38-C5)-methyltransferase
VILYLTLLTLIREAGYTHFVEGTGSVLQPTETLEVKGPLLIHIHLICLQTSKIFSEFLDMREQGLPDAVSHLHQLGLRYFSPEELLRIFHISTPERKFLWPFSITRKTKYRLIGNSVNVAVVTRVIGFLGS